MQMQIVKLIMCNGQTELRSKSVASNATLSIHKYIHEFISWNITSHLIETQGMPAQPNNLMGVVDVVRHSLDMVSLQPIT